MPTKSTTTPMTVGYYAKNVKKCSRQAVLKAITKGKLHLLPLVTGFEKAGNYHILHVKQ